MESELESKYTANHLSILPSWREVWPWELLLRSGSSVRQRMPTPLPRKPNREREPAMLPTGRGRVWIRVLQHISLRGGSFGFKPPPPTGHYFQPLKCFLSLDTFGKFWKIPQEGDWARRAPFLMPSGSTAQNACPPRQPSPGTLHSRLENHGRQKSPVGNSTSGGHGGCY